MYTLYRRHEKKRKDGTPACRYAKQGRRYTKCGCPIWVSDGAKKFRQSLKTRDWAMAERRRRELETGESGVPVSAPAPSLTEAIETFLSDCRSRNLAEASVASYRYVLAALANFLPNDISVRAIDLNVLTAYRQTRRKLFYDGAQKQFKVSGDTISPGYARTELTIQRMFFKFAKERRWTFENENPAKNLKPPKETRRPTAAFTTREVDAIIEATRIIGENSPQRVRVQARALALVYTFLYSGLRISDVAKLRRAQMDLATGKILLRTMKTGTPMYVRMPPEAVAALAAVPAESAEYFFWTGKSKLSTHKTSIRRTIARLLELAGVKDGHPHRFRDTFAEEFLCPADGSDGGDIYELSLLLGHSTTVTTLKHYTPFGPKMQRRLDGSLSHMRFGSRNHDSPVDPQDHALRDGNKNVLPFPAKLRA